MAGFHSDNGKKNTEKTFQKRFKLARGSPYVFTFNVFIFLT